MCLERFWKEIQNAVNCSYIWKQLFEIFTVIIYCFSYKKYT